MAKKKKEKIVKAKQAVLAKPNISLNRGVLLWNKIKKPLQLMGTVLEWGVFALLVVTFLIVLSPLLPTKNYIYTYIVATGSMEKTIMAGSVAFVKPAQVAQLKKGDIITFTSPKDNKSIILHRIFAVKQEKKSTVFITKGDNNNAPDNWKVNSMQIKGQYLYSIPYIGHVGAFVKTPKGFGMIVVIPALILALLQVKTIKLGIEEEVERRTKQIVGAAKKSTLRSIIMLALIINSLTFLGVGSYVQALYVASATMSGVSFNVIDFVPPSTPTGLSYISPSIACGGTTNSYTITADWNDSTAHGSKTIDHYEYVSFNPTTGWMWGPVNVAVSQRAGAFTVGEGTYGFRVRAVDSLGYFSEWTSIDFAGSCKVTYTLTPPAPTQTGYNVNDSTSADLPRNPNQLACTGAFTNINGVSVHWTDVSGGDTHIKYERQYSNNGSSWTGSEIYTTPYTNYRTFGYGQVIHYSRVRSFYDANSNGARDISELPSDWSNVCSITYSLAPFAPSLISPSNNALVKSTTLTNSWSSVVGAIKYIYESYHDEAATVLRWNQEVIAPATSKTATGVADATFWWRVKAVNLAGQESPWSTLWKVTIDNTKPTSAITSPTNGGSHTTTYLAGIWDGVITGTATDSATGVTEVQLSIHDDIANTYWNGSAWIVGTESTVRVLATGTTAWSYTLSPAVAGTYTITAHAVDGAGNVENSYVLTIVSGESTAATPELSLTLADDKKSVSFSATNISADKLSYTLSYDAFSSAKGVVGTDIDVTGLSEYRKNSIDLATCSGAVCTYDQEVKNITLTVMLTDTDGKETVLEKSL